MEQKIERIGYASLDGEIRHMKDLGYIIKQISGSGNDYYVWVLFERNNNIKEDTII